MNLHSHSYTRPLGLSMFRKMEMRLFLFFKYIQEEKSPEKMGWSEVVRRMNLIPCIAYYAANIRHHPETRSESQ